MTALRFYVHEAHGYAIRPRAFESGSSSKRPWPVGYFVLDRAWTYRAVAAFPQGQTWWSPGSRNAEAHQRKAHAKAEELNAWDAAELAA